MTVINKDIPTNKNLLGQFLTPREVVEFCLAKTDFKSNYIIEPSCGNGSFLDMLRAYKPECKLLGVELDSSLSKTYHGKELIVAANFYDYRLPEIESVHFIGNPPYRSPAYSLQTHTSYIHELRDVYGIRGVREEAVLFLAHTVKLIEAVKAKGYIDYILPRAIFKNNSPVFSAVAEFFKKHLCLKSIWNLDDRFPTVSRNLVYASFETGAQTDTFLMDGVETPISEFYGVGDEILPFQRIFKKTYLGSVPCEGLFLSCKWESKDDFRERLYRMFSSYSPSKHGSKLVELLSYEGKPHLRTLRNKNADKIATMIGYWKQVDLHLNSIEFAYDKYYKPIRHRDENRWYFRHEKLKKCKFVYQLNPNPCPSFYFPGNPSNTSKDYFGYCDYDINRNSGPGANRTVPTHDLENNLTDEFKELWKDRPLTDIFDYMKYIGEESEWYKGMKKKYERFYFGIPKEFDNGFCLRKQ